jgi:hypothetical protein
MLVARYHRRTPRPEIMSAKSRRLTFVIAFVTAVVAVSCRDASSPTASLKHPGNPSAICEVGASPGQCFPVPVDSDSLSLVCTDSVGQPASAGTIHRGDRVSCTASALAEIRRIKSWKFASLDSSLKTSRAETDPDSTHFSNVWAGQMVTSGTVSVVAKVGADTNLRSAVARVTVLPRDWVHASDPAYVPVPGWPVVPQYVGQGTLLPMPTKLEDLGNIKWHFHGNEVLDAAGVAVPIVTGPNSPVYFIAKMPPVLDTLYIEIDTIALKAHSAFWEIQKEFSSTRTYTGRVPCFQDDVTAPATFAALQAHEGTNWDTGSHAAVFRSLTFATLVPAAESVYAKISTGGRASIGRRWETVVLSIALTIDSLAKKPVDASNPVVLGSSLRNNIGCKFKY